MSGRQGAHEGNSGFQAEDRFEFVLKFSDGRDAVEHESGAVEVGGAALVGEDAGAVCEVPVFESVSAEFFYERIELLKLGAGECCVFVGGGQVGADALDL